MNIDEIIQKKVDDALRGSHLELPAVHKDASGADKSRHLCIITDQPIDKQCRWLFLKLGLKIHEYSYGLMANRVAKDFKTEHIDLLWINISRKDAREWLQIHYTELTKEWYIVALYQQWSDWITDTEAQTIMSFKQFTERLHHLDAEDMAATITNISHRRIKKPEKAGCLKMFFKSKFKKKF